jgi:DegV family protein with EDD domain
MIKILTDSTADLSQDLCREYNIEVIPLYITFGDKVYKEGIDISKEEFYRKLREFEPCGLPTTSQPTPKDFIDRYAGIQEDTVISIHISSKLSGTCESANLARKSTSKDITIIDSGMVSVGLGLLVLYAAKAVKAGWDKEQIIQFVNQLKNKIIIYFTVENLRHLEKGGRIGKAQSLLGSILHIIPILSFKEGIIVPAEKIRGSKKVLPKYKELISGIVGKSSIDAMLINAECEDKTKELEKMLMENFKCTTATTSIIGGVVGTHAGPGTWGLAFCPSQSFDK